MLCQIIKGKEGRLACTAAATSGLPGICFETLGGLHSDAFALLEPPQGLLNQAIVIQEDVEGRFVLRRVSFIIAAAVGPQLAARRV